MSKKSEIFSRMGKNEVKMLIGYTCMYISLYNPTYRTKLTGKAAKAAKAPTDWY